MNTRGMTTDYYEMMSLIAKAKTWQEHLRDYVITGLVAMHQEKTSEAAIPPEDAEWFWSHCYCKGRRIKVPTTKKEAQDKAFIEGYCSCPTDKPRYYHCMSRCWYAFFKGQNARSRDRCILMQNILLARYYLEQKTKGAAV